jgi:hypothetical protein
VIHAMFYILIHERISNFSGCPWRKMVWGPSFWGQNMNGNFELLMGDLQYLKDTESIAYGQRGAIMEIQKATNHLFSCAGQHFFAFHHQPILVFIFGPYSGTLFLIN